MPKVDFYVLSEKHTPDIFVCQLAQKIWQQGHQIYIHTDHQQQAEQLDTRLWTFSDISFVPHEVWSESVQTPVTIGWHNQYSGTQEVLINLNRQVPEFCDGFARIAEIVTLDQANKDIGRTHFRQYREKGFELESHQL